MRKYNLYMNEICNVYYLIAKFKFNPFKYSYVIFYDFGTLFLFFALFFFLLSTARFFCTDRIFFELFSFCCSAAKITLMKNYMAKKPGERQESKIKAHNIFYSCSTRANSIFTKIKMGKSKEKWGKNCAQKSYYHLWGFKKRYFILLIHNLLSALFFYFTPFSVNFMKNRLAGPTLSMELHLGVFFLLVRCYYFHRVFRMLVFLDPALLFLLMLENSIPNALYAL